MQKGWPAKNLLKPLWLIHGGRKAVAAAAGVSEGHMSKVNSGKANLGLDVATKIASACSVSVLELGAPEEQADKKGWTLQSRLEELEGTLADVLDDQLQLRQRVARLEAAREEHGDGPGDHRAAAS